MSLVWEARFSFIIIDFIKLYELFENDDYYF